MKRTIFLICMIVSASVAKAQTGLQIDSLFSGKIIPKTRCIESIVRGGRLKEYKLDYFRSMRFKAGREEILKISSWLKEDAQLSEEQDSEYKEGVLVYMLLRIAGEKPKENIYIGYQLKPVKETVTVKEKNDKGEVKEIKKETVSTKESNVTVVFLKGKATLEDLRKIF